MNNLILATFHGVAFRTYAFGMTIPLNQRLITRRAQVAQNTGKPPVKLTVKAAASGSETLREYAFRVLDARKATRN